MLADADRVKIAEVIDKRLADLNELFRTEGQWNGEDYMKMVMPLHNALLFLTYKKLSKPLGTNGDDHGDDS